jgi:prepilin-type N-terminal cleavage/methylation domain-containing protein
MDQRGVTLVELLVALLVGSIVLLGVGSFYLKAQDAIEQGNYQVAMQRQGTLVQQQMARIILASSGLLAGTCGPAGAADSLPVQIPANALFDSALSGGGFVCFYLQSNQIMECRFASTSSTTCTSGSARSLLAGAPIRDPIQAAIPAGSTTMFNRVGGTAADINFALTAGVVGPLSFGTRLTVKN